jgi:uncharacterized protein YoxC
VIGSLGGVAAIFAAVAWAILALGLFVVMLQVFRVLESTKTIIDDIRRSTVPLLGEVRTTVTSVNKELQRVDGVMESAGKIAKSAERVTTMVEHAVASPLVKIAAFGAGASRALRRLRKSKE